MSPSSRLVKIIVPTLIALATFSCAGAEQTATHRLDYQHPPGGGMNDYIMVLDGVNYSDRDAFIAAVAKLPPRSRLRWYSGCIGFNEIPLGPAPRMSIPAFKTFCSSHRIRFDYQSGLLPDPLISKTFSVPRSLVTAHPDARLWLESQGVTFPPKSFARWESDKEHLAVRNAQQDIELIALIIERANSK